MTVLSRRSLLASLLAIPLAGLAIGHRLTYDRDGNWDVWRCSRCHYEARYHVNEYGDWSRFHARIKGKLRGRHTV